MPRLPFIKMHGAKNDYIFFDGMTGSLPRDPGVLAKRICNRHTGIGADGIICMVSPSDESFDVQMQIWNADGSAAEMCGNAARCIAVWMQSRGRVSDICRIQTSDRIITAHEIHVNGELGSAIVDMGAPKIFTADAGQTIELADGVRLVLHRVHIGNPHAVVFVDELTDELVMEVGPEIEQHPIVAQRTNVEFVVVRAANELLVRVWERGSGETQACGSGACAVVAVAVNTGRIPNNQPCRVVLPGGVLTVHWNLQTDNIRLSGPVEIAFTGNVTDDS